MVIIHEQQTDIFNVLISVDYSFKCSMSKIYIFFMDRPGNREASHQQ